MSGTTEAKKAGVDWPAVKLAYRAGIQTLREIGQAHGVSHAAVSKRAKKDGWTRDLGERIRAKTAELVSKDAVTNSVSKDQRVTERVVVEANAALAAGVLRGHKKGLGRLGELRDSLTEELRTMTDNAALFQRLGELLDTSGTDDNGRNIRDLLNETYQKVISTPGRVDSLKKLTEVDEKIRRGEREAYGIEGAGSDGNDPLASLLAKIGRSAMPVVYELPVDDDEAAAL